jgi:hypothetical protein
MSEGAPTAPDAAAAEPPLAVSDFLLERVARAQQAERRRG